MAQSACPAPAAAHLGVGPGEQPPVNQPVLLGVPRGPIHDVGFACLVRQANGWQDVRAQVDGEDEDGGQGQGQVADDVDEERGQLWQL